MSRQLILETASDLEKLDTSYLRLVRDNMRFAPNNPTPTVQFGLTGTGQTPNYQTYFSKKRKTPRHGNSPEHKQFDKTEQFDESNLSRSFSYQEIQQAIAKKS